MIRTSSKHRTQHHGQNRRPEGRLQRRLPGRNVDQVQDYTNYARGVFGSFTNVRDCRNFGRRRPVLHAQHDLQETEKNTHLSQEFRLSTPDDWRVRAIGGAYWEEYKIYDDTNWLYKTVPTCTPSFDTNCFNNVQPWPGVPANNPNVRNDNVGFFDDFQRSIYQKAAFGSVDVGFDSEDADLYRGNTLLPVQRGRTRRRRRQLLL